MYNILQQGIIMTKRESSFFKAAKTISKLSDHKQKVGCVVINKHRIISSGYNSNTKRHKMQAVIDKERFGCDCDGKIHSETAALLPMIKSNVDLSRASIYVFREHKDGTIAMARPCSGCMKLIKMCGIKNIYYIFMCKCKFFAERFGVPQYSGMLLNDLRMK